MVSKTFAILFVIYLLNFVAGDAHKKHAKSQQQQEADVFVPTHEWQAIREGQAIPKGLHVRINLQTGLKEAKLMDENEHSRALQAVEDDARENNNEDLNSNIYSPEMLKELLQNMKEGENFDPSDAENQDSIKEKFKSYEQLKKELGDLKVSLKSDVEILQMLFKEIEEINADITNEDSKEEELIPVLEDFEYLVHQIDNANEFIKFGGLQKVVYKNLNSSVPKIRCKALNIFGATVQNNAKAQIQALESNAIDKLIKLLALNKNGDKILNKDSDVKLCTVSSLSSLLRRFPLAQKHFIDHGGLSVFASIFDKPENMKIHLKIVTLIYDLLTEEQEAKNDTESPDFRERRKQYEAVNLKNRLIEDGWCKTFNNILVNNVIIGKHNHDSIERCLNILTLVAEDCNLYFANQKMMNALQELHAAYLKLSREETEENFGDSYFGNLRNITHNLLVNISRNYKTEL